MNRQDLVEKVKSYPNSNNLPVYTEAEDINDGMLLIDGKWINKPYAWGIVEHEKQWIFFLTDEERGFVLAAKSFNNESEACDYAANRLLIKAKSLQEWTLGERLVYFIRKEFNYTEENAIKAVIYLLSEPDIFDEFFRYVRNDRFTPDNQIEELGYTAEKIHMSYGASLLESYILLAYLRKDPEKALSQLKSVG